MQNTFARLHTWLKGIYAAVRPSARADRVSCIQK